MGVPHVAKVFGTASPGRMNALQRPPTRTSMRRVSRGMPTVAVLNNTEKWSGLPGPDSLQASIRKRSGTCVVKGMARTHLFISHYTLL